jgi:hypothetical protein
MANARTRFDALADYLQQHHEAQQGQCFGKRCLMFEGEPFIVRHRDSVAFRLSGNALTQALAMNGASAFDPARPDEAAAGKPGWVLVPTAHFLVWDRLATEALRCVRLAQVQNVSWQVAPAPPKAPDVAPSSTTQSLGDRVAAIMKSGFGFGLSKDDK